MRAENNRGTGKRRRELFRQWAIFGPVFAGIQTFIEVVRLAGDGLNVGRLASWLINNWTHLTREFWSRIFEHFPDVELAEPEKDALTTTMFFLPLALSSLHVALTNSNNQIDTNKYNYFIKFIGLLMSIVLLFIVGRQVYNDTANLFANVRIESTLLPIIGLGLAVLLLAYAVVVSMFYLRNMGGLPRVIRWGGSATGISTILLTAIPLSASLYLYAGQIGIIRSLAILIVTSSILITAVTRPSRILLLAQIVIFLIAAAFVSETIFDQLGDF